MSSNTFGRFFKIHTFGESHGPALGAVIDGCPAGVSFDLELLKRELQRRRPGQNAATTARNEADTPEILSGVFENKTLGTPITVVVRNLDQRSEDYQNISTRAGHADDVWKTKFSHTDHRGGGRSSGRETLARVIGGAVAQMFLKNTNVSVRGCSFKIGEYELSDSELDAWITSKKSADLSPMRFPSEKALDAQNYLIRAKEEGQSYGGVVTVIAENIPAGLGSPVFHKIKADLAHAMMSIGATSAFEIGSGVQASSAKGTEFHKGSAEKYGGIRGGITTGETISCRVHFKPTSSILDVAKKGRHDPCIVPRAVPVVESMMNLVIADAFLAARLDQI